jgi:hypothetical protein
MFRVYGLKLKTQKFCWDASKYYKCPVQRISCPKSKSRSPSSNLTFPGLSTATNKKPHSRRRYSAGAGLAWLNQRNL